MEASPAGKAKGGEREGSSSQRRASPRPGGRGPCGRRELGKRGSWDADQEVWCQPALTARPSRLPTCNPALEPGSPLATSRNPDPVRSRVTSGGQGRRGGCRERAGVRGPERSGTCNQKTCFSPDLRSRAPVEAEERAAAGAARHARLAPPRGRMTALLMCGSPSGSQSFCAGAPRGRAHLPVD